MKMVYKPLTMARRHILGDLYKTCDRAQTVPVYLGDAGGEILGHAEEGGGPYADSMTFHVSEEICKKIAGGQFDYTFGTELTGRQVPGTRPSMRRVRLTSIHLVVRRGADGIKASADVVNPPEGKPKRRMTVL
jgi:hypothetical protein